MRLDTTSKLILMTGSASIIVLIVGLLTEISIYTAIASVGNAVLAAIWIIRENRHQPISKPC